MATRWNRCSAMRRVALAVVLLGIVPSGAILIGRGGERAHASASIADPPVAESRIEVVTPGLPQVAEPRRAQTLVVPSKAHGPTDFVRLAGTVVVLDADGTECAVESGSFGLIESRVLGAVLERVRVVEGRWSVDVPRRRDRDGYSSSLVGFSVLGFDLGGRKGVADFEGRRSIPQDGVVNLRARWSRPSNLRVRDRIDGRELSPVLVTPDPCGPYYRHPGLGFEARDLGPSPAELIDDRLAQYRMPGIHVGSPGYAWCGVIIDNTQGGERVVELDRAGELQVVVDRALEFPGAYLRLQTETGRRVLASRLPGAEFVVDSLAPDRLEVKVVDDSGTRVLGSATVTIEAGQRTTVRIPLEEPAPIAAAADPVPLEGWLVLPTEWRLDRFQLELVMLTPDPGGRNRPSWIDRSQMMHDGPSDTFRWSAGLVPPGEYRARFAKPGFQTLVTVGSAGLRDARIEVPPPCEVAVQCVDSSTGREAAIQGLEWCPAQCPRGDVREEARWDPSSGRWRFRAPVSNVLLSASGVGLSWKRHEFELHAGWNEITLRVDRLPAPAAITLILSDGGTIVPWPRGGEPRLEPADGQEDDQLLPDRSGERWTLSRRLPGFYRLELPPIDGFEPVPDELVRLESGGRAEHIVELRRRP